MDQIISILIKAVVFLAGFAKPLARIGIGSYSEWKPGEKIRLLLVGYNGARNTGADARVVAIVKQIREIFGPEQVEITVMTLSRKTLAGYFPKDVRLLEFSSIFLLDLYRACCVHHAAILCEGSTLKSTFANALTLFFCEASGIMTKQGKPCIAYGSEVGAMETFLERFSSKMCKKTYFITRTEESQMALTALGLKGHVGTDTAWIYDDAITQEEAKKLLINNGWDGQKPLLGIAAIDPFCWPVRSSMFKWIRGFLTRDWKNQYEHWYFFSDSPERRAAFGRYINGVAGAVLHFQKEYDFFPVLIGMERMDIKACKALQKRLKQPCAVFPSGKYSADIMTGVLNQLSMLVTSRYHASVLSMESGIPIAAISMDERLDGIMRELSFEKKYLLHVTDTDLKDKLYAILVEMQKNKEEISGHILAERLHYQEKMQEMGRFLKTYIERRL